MIEETNFSFPSGHSTFSAAIAVMMIMLCSETPYRRVAWLIGIAFALSTGFSRVYLGVHYPTDVWAGWTNGTLTALLVYYFVFRGRYLSDDPAVSKYPPMNNLSPNTPFWLRNGHADTIFAKFLQRPSPAYRRELLPDSTAKHKLPTILSTAPIPTRRWWFCFTAWKAAARAITRSS